MDLKTRILQYMRHDAYKPLDDVSIADGLQLTREDLVQFWPAMEELEASAEIIRTRNDKYGVPERMNLVVGRLSMTGKGFGFVIPDRKESETDTDVFVPGSQLGGSMHNDRVVVRIQESSSRDRSREGEVIRIVEHANRKIVGTFESSKSFGFVTPDDAKIRQDIFISKKDFHGAKIGAKVVAEITKWPEGRRNAEGKIVEVLGMAGDPGVDVLSVIYQYDLPLAFPEKVEKEIKKIEPSVQSEDYRGRKDRRDFHIVTIDGDDAKDLDDGVYVEKRPHGGFFLGVYIADVSHYVRENSPLDQEARARGTSVYLVDRVIPMLPEKLSNGICSLNAGEDRLAMAAEMEIGADGQLLSYEILPAVIHVYRRLTYNIVNKMLVDQDARLCDDNADILPMLKNMEALCRILKSCRRQRGAIDFDLPEVKVKLDTEGKPVALIRRMGSLAESMIEQCMLQANETVAEHMDKKMLPFMYRVHEQPSGEKMDALNKLLATFGLYIAKNAEDSSVHPKQLQKVLEQVAGRPEERIISSVSLRSMQQARYDAASLGHFGLAARYYTHFTSPIRRYPDLIVHRLLRETFKTGTISKERQEKLKGILPEIAVSSSLRERIATEAERETLDMKKIEYMAQFVGEEFSGVISGVTAFGLFVELDNGVEGLVHVSSMENDYYAYVADEYSLVGERTNMRYRLGDAVDVVLVNANIEERNIDFILKGNGIYNPVQAKKKPQMSEKKSAPRTGKKPDRKTEIKTEVKAEIQPGKKSNETKPAKAGGAPKWYQKRKKAGKTAVSNAGGHSKKNPAKSGTQKRSKK